MTDMKAKVVGGLCVAAMMVLAMGMVSPALADSGSQTWYADNLLPGNISILNMETASEVHKSAYIYQNKDKVWIEQNPAQVDVSFGTDTWSGSISIFSGNLLTVEVGSYGGSEFTAAGSQAITTTPEGYSYTLSITPSSDFSISSGDYLALRVSNDDSSGIRVDYGETSGDYCTYVNSPSTDPGYPVPELNTFILFGIGLLALAGYVGLWRRRK